MLENYTSGSTVPLVVMSASYLTVPNVVRTTEKISKVDLDPNELARGTPREKSDRLMSEVLYSTDSNVQKSLDRTYHEWQAISQDPWHSRFIKFPKSSIHQHLT